MIFNSCGRNFVKQSKLIAWRKCNVKLANLLLILIKKSFISNFFFCLIDLEDESSHCMWVGFLGLVRTVSFLGNQILF